MNANRHHAIRTAALAATSLAAHLFTSCSSVAPTDAFSSYKKTATSLKSESEKVFDDALKLDLNVGLKSSTAIATNRAAEANQALQKKENQRYVLKNRKQAIDAAVDKVANGTDVPSELVDSHLKVRKKAQAALDKALKTPDTKPAELQKLKDDVSSAEKALDEAVKDLAEEGEKIPNALAKMDAEIANLKKRNKESDDHSTAMVSQLELDARGTTTDPFRWGRTKGEMPSSLKLKHQKAKVLECMSLFEEYCDLLGKLANPELVNTTKFDESTRKINTSANKILNLDLNVAKGREIALISTAASQAARIYLQNRQASQLKMFIETNQGSVDEFVRLMQGALVLLRLNLDAYYLPSIHSASGAAQSTDVNGEAKRAAGIASIFTLNDTYAGLIENIKTLSLKLNKLSEDHAKLAKAVVSPSLSTAYADSAGGQIESITSGYQKGLSQNRYQDALFVADASDKIAIGYERKYALANIETLRAKARYDIAKAASDSKADDENLKLTTKELYEKYILLKADSDAIKVDADYYRSRNTIDKNDAARLKPTE